MNLPLPYNIAALEPYTSARSLCKGDSWTFMDANESPVPGIELPSLPSLNRYPDPTADRLRDAIAATFSASRENLVLGNGSDELIDLCVRAFVRPGREVMSAGPTYGVYAVCSAVQGVPYRTVSLTKKLLVDVPALLGESARADILFLCSPNNPTGLSLPRADLARIVREFRGIVVVDEAYGEFADDAGIPSAIKMVKEGAENLVVLRTFSKAFGAAGIRLGYAVGSRFLIGVLLRIKPPYNVNALTQAVGLALWDKREDMQKRVTGLKRAKTSLMEACAALGCIVIPSVTNFFLILPPEGKSADGLLRRLRDEERIVLRRIADTPVLTNALRITVGMKEQNLNLISALTYLLSS